MDKNRAALEAQQVAMRAQFPAVTVHYLNRDFTKPLELPLLDGLVITNALHFVRDKERVLQMVHAYLRPGGRLILVEYNLKQGNPWVPYPIPLEAWQGLAERSGFTNTRLLATRPSRYHRGVYAALSIRP